MQLFSLKDKVAVVTGGGSGIGKATAERFIKAGANVVIANRSDATELAAQLGAVFVKTDVAVEREVEGLVAETVRRFGRIDILVNNAGYFGATTDITEADAEVFKQAFAVNTLGTLYGIKHAAPVMPSGGAIICVTSLAAQVGIPGYAAYAASKWATSGIVRCAALELGPKGIRVNEVCPGTTDTPMLRNQDSAQTEIALSAATSAIDRLIAPEDIAALIHFLASTDTPTLSGQKIAVDGGATAGVSINNINAILTGI
ncbi:SDR family NAD(P)-dependent oxidoreductase [Erwinia sp. V71]|uniref:SDR family NAD(P)-dependent oxidoreductase n=1 Tax=Erwinia sp. V71 TaxID=3369424 RepID=UPI003F62D543